MLPSFPSAQDTVICCPFYQFSGITATYHRNDAKFPCYNRGMTGASSLLVIMAAAFSWLIPIRIC
jgi:hypothetical protein